MKQWHISPDGVARKCNASVVRCEYTHADSEAGAYAANEQIMSSQGYETFTTKNKHEEAGDKNQYLKMPVSQLRTLRADYSQKYELYNDYMENYSRLISTGEINSVVGGAHLAQSLRLREANFQKLTQVDEVLDTMYKPTAKKEKLTRVQALSKVNQYVKKNGDKFPHPAREIYSIVQSDSSPEDKIETIDDYMFEAASTKETLFHFNKISHLLFD